MPKLDCCMQRFRVYVILDFDLLGKMKMRQISVLGMMGLALMGCDYTPPASQTAQGAQVGATGNIQYTFEELTPTRRFLTVTAAPGIGETEGSIKQRMYQFAVRFASTKCPNEYSFIDDPNMYQASASGFMRRTHSYVFECK